MKGTIKYSKSDYIFLTFDWMLLTVTLVVILYPLLFVIKASFSHGVTVMSNFSLIPEKFSLEGYKAVFEFKQVWVGYRNSAYYMILGTTVNLFVTICAAYPLSRSDLKGKNLFMFLFVFTMYFSGGLIPTFLLVRNMKMLDTVWAMVLPGAMSVYNMIVMRTYFKTQIPEDLLESAELDGCGNIRFLMFIVLPLSTPIIAVIGLFYAVGHWNSYFPALMYLISPKKFPLQIVLREILVLNRMLEIMNMQLDEDEILMLEQRANLMKYSLIVVASLPVLIIYPFVQKYFVKGIMIGAIKG